MILSIDIGIRTLALCVLNCTDPKDTLTYTIELWKSYDTLEDDQHSCKGIQKNGKICGKNCSYKYDLEEIENYSCKTHFPKEIEIKPKHSYSKKKIKDYLLQDLAKAMIITLNSIISENKELMTKIDTVLIELQPSFSPKMCFISHVLYGKLTEFFINQETSIKFIRASEKLKVYDGPELICKLKGAYAKRKWESIQHAKYFLKNKFNEEQCLLWSPFLLSGKVDDISDVLCYSMYHYCGKRPSIKNKATSKKTKIKFVRKKRSVKSLI